MEIQGTSAEAVHRVLLFTESDLLPGIKPKSSSAEETSITQSDCCSTLMVFKELHPDTVTVPERGKPVALDATEMASKEVPVPEDGFTEIHSSWFTTLQEEVALSVTYRIDEKEEKSRPKGVISRKHTPGWEIEMVRVVLQPFTVRVAVLLTDVVFGVVVRIRIPSPLPFSGENDTQDSSAETSQKELVVTPT